RAIEVAAQDPGRAAIEGVVAARDALEKLACAEDYPLADLACTLIVAIAADGVCIAHVGDGAAVGWCNGEAYVLSPPAPTEYVNEVDPLTSDDWIDHIRPVVCADGVDAIGLFTDGCQHAALRRDNGHHRAHGGFFGPLFAYARSGV